MLDKPDKTACLIATLKAAVPFEVELLAQTMTRLRENNPEIQIGAKEMVFDIAYEPHHGGIICLIRPAGTDGLVATSLTNIRIHPTKPFAAAVADYQKHRRKKLRQRPGSRTTATLSLLEG
jgi:hypothetical protein